MLEHYLWIYNNYNQTKKKSVNWIFFKFSLLKPILVQACTTFQPVKLITIAIFVQPFFAIDAMNPTKLETFFSVKYLAQDTKTLTLSIAIVSRAILHLLKTSLHVSFTYVFSEFSLYLFSLLSIFSSLFPHSFFFSLM